MTQQNGANYVRISVASGSQPYGTHTLWSGPLAGLLRAGSLELAVKTAV